MNYRKMMLVAFLLLAVLTLGAVSASEDADALAADSVDEASVDASLDDEIISEGGEDSLASSDDSSTLGEDDEEEEDDWVLDYNSGLISFRELVTLSDRFDSGSLVITDSNENELFNKEVSEMEPNYDMMGYKYDQYRGYVVFKEDLDNVGTGVYDLTITYYDDDDEVVETVDTTVYLDFDSYVNDTEIDITDYNSTLFGVYVFDVMDDGWFEIEITGEDDDEDPYIVSEVYGYEANTILAFTRDSFNDTELGEGIYKIHVRYVPNVEEYDYWKYYYFHDAFVYVVDNTKFRVRMESESILDENSIFFVYCPQGYDGRNITINVASEDNDALCTIDCHIVGAGYINFTLDELDITQPGLYRFDVYNEDGDNLIETYEYEIANPLFIPDVCVIGSEGLERSPIVVLSIDMDDTGNGRLVLKDENETVLFDETLGEDHYETLGYDKGYWILWSDVNLTAGIQTFTAEYYYNGNLILTKSKEVNVVERKYVVDNETGISIELYNYYDHDLGDEWDSIATVSIPDYDGGYVQVSLWDEEVIYSSNFYEIDDDDGLSIIEVRLFDQGIDEGAYYVTVTYYNLDLNPVLSLSDWMSFHYGSGDDDDIIDEIEFNLIGDDEESVFEKGDCVHVASLFIPENDEHVESGVTITITKNGEEFDEFSTSGNESTYHENMGAYEYPIYMNLTELEDRDLLEFNVDCLDENGRVWPYAIEINGDEVIFHWYEEIIDYYVFYGNITTRDLNDPELMGPHPDGNFVRLAVPEAYNVSEGSVVITYSNGTTILDKSLDDFEDVGYSYEVLGNVYAITLDEYQLMGLAENDNITVTLTAGDVTITQKRIRIGDYMYKILTPDDFAFQPWSEYNFEVADEAYGLSDDAVIIYGNSNMQSIYIDFGGGYFNIYVNDVKVENLGHWLWWAWLQSDNYEWEYDEGAESWGTELYLEHLRGGSVALSEFHMSPNVLNISEPGTYNIRITHIPEGFDGTVGPISGDGEFIYGAETEIVNKNIDVLRMTPTLTIPDVIVVGDSADAAVVATLKDANDEAISGVKVKIVVGSLSKIAKTDANGQVSLDISSLAPGQYSIAARSAVTNDYNEAKASAQAIIYESKITPILTIPDVVTVYNTDGAVVATLKDANGDVISGVKVKIVVGSLSKIAKTDANGQVSLDISSLAPGVYSVGARSAITDLYNEAKNTSAKAYISEDKVNTTLTIPDVEIQQGTAGAVVAATLKDVYGNIVSGVKVKLVVGDLSKIAKTDANGQVSLDISGLAVGEYRVAARSAITDIYNEAKAYAKATVTKVNPTLTIPDVVAVCNTPGAVVVATLKDANGDVISGVKVKIVVGSLSKIAKTDANGQVSLDISSLAPGVYSVGARSAITDLYNEAKNTSAKAYISEDKVNTTLTIPNVEVQQGTEGAAAVATLKDVYGNIITGVKVKLVVGDLSKIAKTDANGQVSLDISGLAPGTYKVSARSAITDLYNEAKAYAKATIYAD